MDGLDLRIAYATRKVCIAANPTLLNKFELEAIIQNVVRHGEQDFFRERSSPPALLANDPVLSTAWEHGYDNALFALQRKLQQLSEQAMHGSGLSDIRYAKRFTLLVNAALEQGDIPDTPYVMSYIRDNTDYHSPVDQQKEGDEEFAFADADDTCRHGFTTHCCPCGCE